MKLRRKLFTSPRVKTLARQKPHWMWGSLALLVVLAALLASIDVARADDKKVRLYQFPQINAVTMDPQKPDQFLIGTYYGVFSVTPDGFAHKITDFKGAFSELVRHPKDPQTLIGSGYYSKAEKMGMVLSVDGGKSWQKLGEEGAKKHAFHSLAISPSNANVLYGFEEGLIHLSRDMGKSFQTTGKLDGDVYDLAVSNLDERTLFAATSVGLMVSRDEGQSWKFANDGKVPATSVHVTADGSIYAFLFEVGLVKGQTSDADFGWEVVSNDYSDRLLIDLAVSPDGSGDMLSVVDTGTMMISRNGGHSWTSYEGQQYATEQNIAAGKSIFEENCVACHGVAGVGEQPEDMFAQDEYGFVASPLNDAAHGWHHPDDQLVQTILKGSPRNTRMIAWEEELTEAQARDVVAYIKSLWSFRSLACQGAKHMKCMQ